ncbi:MAG: right-handed parallel beta-helix repeat-containing protein [Planctomycetia bacterium]|nr:right-handed parallel beta-helix repeat-containing protein [Planctomycetia bacterium]
MKRLLSCFHLEIFALVVSQLIFVTGVLSAKTFYVSPSGDDSATGTVASPWETLTKARDAVRAYRAENPSEAVAVELAGGYYFQKTPLVFLPEDSGTADFPVTWRGKSGERAIISGGLTLTDWRDEGDGVFSAPCSISGPHVGTQLFVERRVSEDTQTFLEIPSSPENPDVRRAIRARAPNWNPDDAVGSYFWARKAIPADNQGCIKYRLKKGDIEPFLYDAEGKMLPDVQFMTYQYWSSSFNRIASYSRETGVVEFTRNAGRFYPDQHVRWHIENTRAALDAPGEWYFDRSEKRVFYIPREDEDLSRDCVILSVCPRWLVEIRGDWKENQLVQHLHFENLTFSYSDADISPEYEHSVQAAHTQRGTINATGMASCRITECVFSHLGENGITLLEGCHENVIERNHIYDVGAAGVTFPANPQGVPEDAAIIRENRVENNLIHHTGALFHSSCGIFFGGMAQYNTVMHNEISDTTWAGMQYGWSWGSGRAFTNHNDIGWNHIHHISNGVMNDLAGIYTLGDLDGSRLHHNWIHDVNRYTRDSVGYGGWGIYTDAGTSNLTVDFNLVHDTQDAGLHIHNYSQPYHTVVKNNIFAYADAPGFARNAAMDTEKDFGVAIENNINYNDVPEMLSGGGFKFGPNPRVRLNQNCYWYVKPENVGMAENAENADVKIIPTFLGKSFTEWQEKSGLDVASVVTDPRFVSPEHRDFRLLVETPVRELGFIPFILRGKPVEIGENCVIGNVLEKITVSDNKAGVNGEAEENGKKVVNVADMPISAEELALRTEPKHRAGLYGDAEWVSRATKIRHRPLQIFAPGQFNEPFTADFEEEEPDELPFGVSAIRSLEPERASQVTSWTVTEEDAFSGKKTLKVTDSAEHRNSYDPHVIIQNVFPSGQLAFHFALKIGEGAHLLCETRQYSRTVGHYATGQTFQINPDGVVSVHGKSLTKIPHDEWVEFTIYMPSEPSPDLIRHLTLMRKPLPEQNFPPEWTLKIRTKDGEPQFFGPFPLGKEFQTLEWFAILSLGEKESSYFLDDVRVEPKK